jgi:3-hydroxyisobutyrate dehydrogenase
VADPILFVGLGKLGHLLVGHLSGPAATRGVPLYVNDVDPAPGAEAQRRYGVRAVAEVADVPRGRTVLCLCLPGKAAILAVVAEAERCGLLGADAVVVDFSSVPPDFARQLAAELAERGVAYLDAPVTGGLAAARTGQMVAMVGGSGDALERVRWIMDAFCARVVPTGPPGSGALLKTVNNLVGNVAAIAAMEGIGVLRQAGLADEAILEVLNNGPAATYFSQVRYPRHVMTGTYRSGAELGLVDKDLSIAADALRDLGAQAPLSMLAREMWRGALTRYGPDGDMTMMLDFVTRLSLGRGWFEVGGDPADAPPEALDPSAPRAGGPGGGPGAASGGGLGDASGGGAADGSGHASADGPADEPGEAS